MNIENTADKVVIPLVRKDGNDGNVLAFVKTLDGTAKGGEDFEALEEHEVHFEHHIQKAEVEVKLKNAQNNMTFSVQIQTVEPEGASIGEINCCTVIISNDVKYQKMMDEVVTLMDAEMDRYKIGSSSWSDQFRDAMSMGGDEEDEPSCMDFAMHFLSFYWKVLHAFIPPTDYCGGWATFCVSLCFIGVITCLVGDMAKMFGCVVGLNDQITAITFVALGTSLPDTFASMEATISDDSADAAITNVTGSNSVNVFLGLGLPWTMAVIYHGANSSTFKYPAGDLVFSVLVFFVFAIACIGLLYYRRVSLDAELGGPKLTANIHSGILGSFWIFYVILSSLKTEGHISF